MMAQTSPPARKGQQKAQENDRQKYRIFPPPIGATTPRRFCFIRLHERQLSDAVSRAALVKDGQRGPGVYEG